MKISFVFADKPEELNTSRYRCFIPAKALAAAGNEVSLFPVSEFEQNTPSAQEACSKSEVIIIERNFVGDVITMMTHWKTQGKVIITNFDDGYHAMEQTNVSYPFWIEGMVKVPWLSPEQIAYLESISMKVPDDKKERIVRIFPHPYDQFLWGLKMSHAATLPSKELCKYYNKYTPTYYLPNYFDINSYINIPKEKRDTINIGWGGSLSHVRSFTESGIMEALKDVCRLRSNIRLLVCGDKRVYDIIDLPEGIKIFQPYVPYEKWGELVSKYFDIFVAPLSGKYDRYRSLIKPVEAMLTKTPFIASDGDAYHDMSKYGKIILNSVPNWRKALLEMVDNLTSETEKMNGEPYECGLSYNVNKNTENYIATLRMIAKNHAKIDL
jgi:hypothetical protein